MLSEKNITLDNGNVWGLDTPLKDFVPGFKMYADNATELATTNDFLGTFHTNQRLPIGYLLIYSP
jgi:hypothetical protein